ncbi:MAG: hypothetical protein JRI25_08900 [Deltaproteobacteria bacterium]|nr:hypothetical protein [Deltaproteobacteria bacterium]
MATNPSARWWKRCRRVGCRLDADRLESWRQLRREAAAREMLRDPSAQKVAGRRMAKMIKEVAEERRRRGR